jgi:hypothetical protein
MEGAPRGMTGVPPGSTACHSMSLPSRYMRFSRPAVPGTTGASDGPTERPTGAALLLLLLLSLLLWLLLWLLLMPPEVAAECRHASTSPTSTMSSVFTLRADPAHIHKDASQKGCMPTKEPILAPATSGSCAGR